MQEIIDMEARVIAHGLPKSAVLLRQLKAMGFSDARLAKLTRTDAMAVRAAASRAGRATHLQTHRHLRRRIRQPHGIYVFDVRNAAGECGHPPP